MFRSIALILCLTSPALADVEGRVRVIDGDTLDVSGTRVRLHGIDAPETEQTCEDAQGRVWPCGAFVSEEVARRYQSARARCEEVEQDRYGRSVAKCYVDGRDIGEALVSDGWARAYREYSMDYDLAEKSAQVLGLGLWASSMQEPSAYRADQRVPSPDTPAPVAGCIIKGNISGSGQIYHMPHNRDYANTRIDETRGERWFCSEAEAQSAGWRAARN